MVTQTDLPASFPMVTLYTQFLSMYRHFCFHPPFSSYLFHEDYSLCLCLCPCRYLACHATLSSRQKEGGGEREAPYSIGAFVCGPLLHVASPSRQQCPAKTEGNTEIGEGMCGGGGQIYRYVLFVLHAPFMRVLLLPSLEPRTR